MKKLSIRIGVLVILLFVLCGGSWLWWHEALSPVDPNNQEFKTFVVNQGEGIRSVATRLKAEGLIRNQIAFFVKVKSSGLDRSIQAGDFRLQANMDVSEIIESLTHGVVDVWVTIPEGLRSEEIALKLAQSLSIPEKEFLEEAEEGYMFPDTYLLPKEASAAAVVKILRNTFDAKVTPDIRAAIEAQGLTFSQGIVLASIVEREGVSDSDRPVIAGVLLNRIHDDHPLQVDATLQYALGYQSDEKSWWKKSLYDEDKNVKSAYNTYANVGLPPYPISNPGLSAIKAVAYPADTDYYYYMHDDSGQAHYGRTLEEHNDNVARYL